VTTPKQKHLLHANTISKSIIKLLFYLTKWLGKIDAVVVDIIFDLIMKYKAK